MVLERGRAAPGERGEAPMRLPIIYRGGGGWFIALQVHWGIGKGGRKEIPSFPSPPIVIPPFRDLDLIPSGYDLIPSKGDLGVP